MKLALVLLILTGAWVGPTILAIGAHVRSSTLMVTGAAIFAVALCLGIWGPMP